MNREPRRNRSFFFFNDTATTEIYTLSLHDALPISTTQAGAENRACWFESESPAPDVFRGSGVSAARARRSEEHTSELQSRLHLVCRLLLEKKKSTRNAPCERCSATPRTRSSGRRTP